MKYLDSFKVEVSLKKGILVHYVSGFIIRMAFILYIGLVELASEDGNTVDQAIFTTGLVILAISEVAILLLLLGVWKAWPRLFWPFFLVNTVVILFGLATAIYFFTTPERIQVGITLILYTAIEPYITYATLSHYMELTGGATEKEEESL